MTGTITQILRHPIKSHSREAVARVTLTKGQTMPWDRVWGVVHENSDVDGSTWHPCQNFSRGAKAPGLSAIQATLDESTAQVTLTHPDLPPLCFHPDDEGDKLIAWTEPLMPANRAASKRVIRAAQQGFTDSDFASITLCNMASHRAVEQAVGKELSVHRWRGNIWFDGLAPWEEFDWLDREIRIGNAIVIPRARTDRCIATHSNPNTGDRDTDILSALDNFGHRDFSVRAEIVQTGDVVIGDKVGRIP